MSGHKRDPKSEYYLRVGESFYASQMYEAADLMFSAAISLDPARGYLFARRGLSRHKIGRYAEAISDYRASIKLDGRSCGIHNNLGRSYYRLKRFGPAVREYKRALRCDPDNESVLWNLRAARYWSFNPFWRLLYWLTGKREAILLFAQEDKILLRSRQERRFSVVSFEDQRQALRELIGGEGEDSVLPQNSGTFGQIDPAAAGDLAEALTQALRLEYESIHLYHYYALRLSDEKVAQKLRMIGDIEIDHGRKLAELIKGLGVGVNVDVFGEGLKSFGFKELLDESLQKEVSSIEVFERALALTQDKALIDLLRGFQEDERAHQKIIREIVAALS